MKILALNCTINHPSVVSYDWDDTISMFDFDAVIFNLENLTSGFQRSPHSSHFNGQPCLSGAGTSQLISAVNRRAHEILELMSLGRPVICFLSKPQECFIQTGEKQYSGKGKNQVTTNIVTPFSPVTKLISMPSMPCWMSEARGTEIELRGYDAFSSAWSKLKKYSQYETYFKAAPGLHFLFIKGTSKAVGTLVTQGEGRLLLLPSLSSGFRNESKPVSREIGSTLVELLESLIPSARGQLPAWTQLYKLPGERELEEQIEKIKSDIDDLHRQRLAAQSSLERHLVLKRLIASQGEALENQVAEGLRELGATVTPGIPGRTDLIVTFENRIAVIEVKGLKKSAAEKNAAQLEKWVSDYYAQNDVPAKGILVVNAFCEKPLQARVESAFPHQMIAFSESRQHCLITASQLLALILEGREAPERRPEILRALFDTVGVFPKADPLKNLETLPPELLKTQHPHGGN